MNLRIIFNKATSVAAHHQITSLSLLSLLGLTLAACTSTYEPAPVEIHRPGEFTQGRPTADGTPQFLRPEVPGSSPLNPVTQESPVPAGKIHVKSLDPLPSDAGFAEPSQPPAEGMTSPVDLDKPLTPSHGPAVDTEETSGEHVVVEAEVPHEAAHETIQETPLEPELATTTQPLPAEEPAAAAPQTPPQEATKDALAPTPPALLATSGLKFLWPAHGTVSAAFGPTADGVRNDGLNLTLPKGTPVRASEGGRVVFVGEKVKGFGKLILITHEHGWSSAYAHLDKVNVKKGQKIKRGQVIAFSGQSGSIKSPQLHFELRQGIQAVDPQPYLAH